LQILPFHCAYQLIDGPISYSYYLREKLHSLTQPPSDRELEFARDADVAEFDTIVKGLLEDVATTRKDFYEVDGLGTTAVELIEPGSSSGITQVYGGKNNFFKIETSFSMNIKEEYPC
jgi:hypothetical protein